MLCKYRFYPRIYWLSFFFDLCLYTLYGTAGIAGCMSALNLTAAGVKNIVMLEAGVDAGVGVTTAMPVADPQFLSEIDQGDGLKTFIHATRSGTAVLDDPDIGSIKMIINLYPCSSKDFIKHHGKKGAKAYLEVMLSIQRIVFMRMIYVFSLLSLQEKV